MLYNNERREWEHSGGTQGISRIHVYHHPINNTYRIVGRKLPEQTVCRGLIFLLWYSEIWEKVKVLLIMNCTCNLSCVTIVKLSQRPFQQLNIESRESITPNSGLVSLAGMKCENWDTNIENRDAVSENGEIVKNEVSILDRILDSYKDWESSVNFLLNSTVFWKKVALSLRKLGGAEQETISRIQWPSWITLSSKRCSEMSRGGKQIIQLYTHKTYRFSLDHD